VAKNGAALPTLEIECNQSLTFLYLNYLSEWTTFKIT